MRSLPPTTINRQPTTRSSSAVHANGGYSCVMKLLPLLLFALALPVCGADGCPIVGALKQEVVRDAKDAKSLATAPLHWDRTAWEHFAEGAAAVVALYATDRQTSDFAQRHRSSSTDQFAKTL